MELLSKCLLMLVLPCRFNRFRKESRLTFRLRRNQFRRDRSIHRLKCRLFTDTPILEHVHREHSARPTCVRLE